METVEGDGIEGAVVECGVWAGGCSGLMALASRQFGQGRKSGKLRTFHLFDSFEGMPQPSEHDIEVVESFHESKSGMELDDGSDPSSLVAIGECAANVDDVHALIRALKLDPTSMVIHQGWFQKTVPEAAPAIGPIAILRLDGDWYESTRVCLENLYDHLVDGGFLIVDDYGGFSGCREATDDFLRPRGALDRLVRIDDSAVFMRKPA